MSSLTYAPFGLRPIRYRGGYGANYGSGVRYFIKQGYGSAIAYGDLVYTQNSGNQGYIAPYAESGTVVLGVFLGLLPYYDLTYNTTINKNYYAGTENPSGDIECFIADDPTQVFIAQVNGGPITTTNRGQNIDFGGGGAPQSGTGLSVGYLDFSTVANTSTLPLRIVGWSALAAPGYDPTQATSANQPTYNYAEVTMNPGACETLLGTGR